MRKVSRRPRLELRQRQSLTIKQKVRLAIIVSGSIFITAFISVFIYMNTGTSIDAMAASTYTWKGNTSDDFSVADNWVPNGIPASGDKIIINNSTGSNWPKLYNDVTISELDMNQGQIDLNSYVITVTSDAKLKQSIISNGNMIADSYEKMESCTINNVDFEKTGNDDDESKGSNTFNGSIAISNSSDGDWAIAKDNGDTFNDDILFMQTSTGVLKPARKGTSIFKGNVSTEGSTSVITFGSDGGTVSLQGDSIQLIKGDAVYSPVIKKLSIMNNRNGLALGVPLRISGTFTLSSGIIYTSSSNLLTIGSGISSIGGASDSSYIDGPLSKIGNQAFTFPVGKNGKLRTIRMTAPSSSSAQFTAEYFKSDVSLITGSAMEAALNHISNYEFWTLNRIAGTSNVKVTLSWNVLNGAITNLSDLKIARWDVSSSFWRNGGTVSTTGNITAGTITTSSSMTSYGYFTLGSGSAANPLPVELISLNVERNENYAALVWITASEKDNDFFTIERSRDGKNYEEIGTVRGAGTSIVQVSYQYIDKFPFHGISYYRLKQTDFNGQFEYFGPRSFTLSESKDEFKIISASPNPFIDRLTIRYSSKEMEEVFIKIHRVNGAEVSSMLIRLDSGESSFMMDDVSSLNSGIYIITIGNTEKILASCRVVKK